MTWEPGLAQDFQAQDVGAERRFGWRRNTLGKRRRWPSVSCATSRLIEGGYLGPERLDLVEDGRELRAATIPLGG